MEILSVSKWWELDPDVVGNWSMPDFTDREEFMTIALSMQAKQESTPRRRGEQGLAPGEVEWKGRKK